MPNIEVYPKLGETYPDAGGVPITSVGAIVAESKYIEDAVRDGFLLTWDPLNIYLPQDRTGLAGNAPATAPYVTLGADATLTAERVLTQGPGITITDGGPNGPVTISASATGAVSSVFGRIGAVVAAASDYTSTLVSNVSTVAGATITAALDALNSAISSLTTTVAGKAPADAEYLVSTASPGLSAERVLTAGANITLTPAPGTLTIAAAGGGSGAPTTAQYVCLAADGALTNERILTQGPGISIADGGPGGAVTISATGGGGSGDVVGPASATDNVVTRFDGTTGKLVQTSGVFIDDSNNVSGIANFSCSGNITVGGLVDGVDVAGAAAATYVCFSASGFLANERVITQGTNITITDGGAGGALTIACPNAITPSIGSSVDNMVLRWDGTTARLVQSSTTSIDDAGLLNCANLTTTGVTCASINCSASITVGGLVDGVDVAGANAASYVCLTANSFLPNERVMTGQNGVVITDGGAGANVVVSARVAITNVSAGFMLALTHESNLVVLTGASNITITVPANATVALPIGYRVELLNDSSSSSAIITMSYQAGVTLVAVNGVQTGQIDYQDMLVLTKIATDRWMVTLGQTV